MMKYAILPFLLAASALAAAAPAYNPLSPEWARFISAAPVAGTNSASFRARLAAFRRHHAAGYALYKRQQDAAALPEYEAALRHWADGVVYYDYANSLSNIPRLADSLRAYRIALALGHPQLRLVHFNLACAASRLQDRRQAYEALQAAVKAGYPDMGNIDSDGDLAFLRRGPEWPQQRAALHRLHDAARWGNTGFREVRFGMIPHEVLQREKAPPLREGLWREGYMLWYRAEFMGRPVLLKYRFDNSAYRLQYGAYCFLHLVAGDGGQGFDPRGKTAPQPAAGRAFADSLWTAVSAALTKRYGAPLEEETLLQQGAVFTRQLRWKADDQYLVLLAQGDGTVLDLSLYCSNRELPVTALH